MSFVIEHDGLDLVIKTHNLYAGFWWALHALRPYSKGDHVITIRPNVAGWKIMLIAPHLDTDALVDANRNMRTMLTERERPHFIIKN